MALSQTQIIRSLGDALAWMEKEIQWEVSPAQLGHLTGRIGELYAAMITRGQMALSVNQKGYDVVSGDNERISVKTITSSNHARINKNTLNEVDRIIVLRLHVDEDDISIEEVVDLPTADLLLHCRDCGTHYVYPIREKRRSQPIEHMKIVKEAKYGSYKIKEYENGAIQIENNGIVERVTKPILREVATRLGVSLLNSNGNNRNTRQLGSEVIAAAQSANGI